MAAFAATYSDWRVIKGRKVVQVVFELPLEKADEAYSVLGGMPNPAAEVWCGIARLQEPGAAVSARDVAPNREDAADKVASPSSRPKRAWGDLSPAQQAGLLCGDPMFQQFLCGLGNASHPGRDEAAEAVRRICRVRSRAEITTDNIEWRNLVADFRAWERTPA